MTKHKLLMFSITYNPILIYMQHKFPHRGITRALKALRNIEHESIATRRNTGKIEFEELLRRAVNNIETIKRYGKRFKEQGDSAIIEAYKIYQRLQRLKSDPAYFMGNTHKYPNRFVSAPNARPAAVRWDAAAMMAVTRKSKDILGGWWRPPKKPMPVKHFTYEEMKREFPFFEIRKKREDDA
tara:strand:- start:1052 stop:1600 length:549 start_codon:yes stop_codon:yes gene_type:complete